MMAPEDTEDLISELQTNKHSEILVVAGATSSHLTVSLFSVSQCQRWIRLTTVWVHWLMSLKIWSILPTTTLRANQLPNAKQVSAGVKTETKSNFLYLLFLLVNCSDLIHSVCQYQKLWNTPMAAVVILCYCATVKIFCFDWMFSLWINLQLMPEAELRRSPKWSYQKMSCGPTFRRAPLQSWPCPCWRTPVNSLGSGPLGPRSRSW